MDTVTVFWNETSLFSAEHLVDCECCAIKMGEIAQLT